MTAKTSSQDSVRSRIQPATPRLHVRSSPVRGVDTKPAMVAKVLPRKAHQCQDSGSTHRSGPKSKTQLAHVAEAEDSPRMAWRHVQVVHTNGAQGQRVGRQAEIHQ